MTNKTLPQYEHDGRSLTVSEWAAVTGIRSYDISMRLRQGWTIARILAEVKPTNAPQQPVQPVAIKEEAPRRCWADQLFTHDGVTLDLAGWSKRSGIPIDNLKSGLKSGWGLQRAVSYPVGGAPRVLDPGRSPTITYAGETLLLGQWAKRAGITLSTLHWRLIHWRNLDRVLAPSRKPEIKRYRCGERMLTLKEAASEAGLNYGTLVTRLKTGWKLADALRVPAGAIMGTNSHRRGRPEAAPAKGGGSATSEARRGPAGDHQRESAPKQGFS